MLASRGPREALTLATHYPSSPTPPLEAHLVLLKGVACRHTQAGSHCPQVTYMHFSQHQPRAAKSAYTYSYSLARSSVLLATSSIIFQHPFSPGPHPFQSFLPFFHTCSARHICRSGISLPHPRLYLLYSSRPSHLNIFK